MDNEKAQRPEENDSLEKGIDKGARADNLGLDHGIPLDNGVPSSNPQYVVLYRPHDDHRLS